MKRWFEFVRYMVGLSWQVDRRRTVLVGVFTLATMSSMPLFAVAARQLVEGAVSGEETRSMLLGAAIAVIWVAGIAIGHLSRPTSFELGDLNAVAFDIELVALSGGAPSLEHLENPEYANRLELARSEGGDLFLALVFLSSVAGFALQLIATLALLATVRPILLLLPLFALPGLVAGRWADRHVERVKETTSETTRTAGHLLRLLTQAGPAKEIRVFGLGNELRRRQRDAWNASTEALSRAELRAAAGRSAGQLCFVAGYAGALFLVVGPALNGHETVGAVLLTVILASQITVQASSVVVFANQMQRMIRAVERLRWLREATRPRAATPADTRTPSRIEQGLELEGVSFAYPASAEPVLSDVDLRIPAGSVVALVGENGAGKTTLVKLICRFYEPSSGTIALDGTDIRRFDLAEWRGRLTAGFQDFARIEVLARETVGLGDLPRIDDARQVSAALERAQAADVVERLANGLETPLGRSWSNGSELSGGQWQKLALGRTMMRELPLILLLDEPTAALDAHAEHLLFEQYARSTREAARTTGAITLLVSHRFSTVRMADLIVVVDDGRIVESGSHAELMARNSTYPELYSLQADAYR